MGASTSPDSDKHQPIDSVHEGAQTRRLYVSEKGVSTPVQPVQGGATTTAPEGAQGGQGVGEAAVPTSSSPPTAPTTSEMSATATTSTESTSTESISTTAAAAAAAGPDTKRKRHVKSRTGCYNCKKRKVKCNEHWPECYNCKRLRMVCEYPWAPPPAAKQRRTTTTTDCPGGGNSHTYHHQCCIHGHHDGMSLSRGSISSESGTSTGGGIMMPYENGYRSGPSAPLRTTPTVLTMEDLRFYHQFMTVGFPSFQSKSVWEQCAAMSSHVSFFCFFFFSSCLVPFYEAIAPHPGSSHDRVANPYNYSPPF